MFINTPANARKTTSTAGTSGSIGKHSRERGEDDELLAQLRDLLGNTPANAGKTPAGRQPQALF